MTYADTPGPIINLVATHGNNIRDLEGSVDYSKRFSSQLSVKQVPLDYQNGNSYCYTYTVRNGRICYLMYDNLVLNGIRLNTSNVVRLKRLSITIESPSDEQQHNYKFHLESCDVDFIDRLYSIRLRGTDYTYYDFTKSNLQNDIDIIYLNNFIITYTVVLDCRIDNVDFVFNKTYYNTIMRNNLREIPYYTKNVSSYSYNNIEYISGDNIILDTNASINGFFISGNGVSIDNIQSIKLKMNGSASFHLDSNFYVKLVCKEIGDCLIYIPLNDNLIYDINEQSIELGRIDLIELVIELDQDHQRQTMLGIGCFYKYGTYYCANKLITPPASSIVSGISLTNRRILYGAKIAKKYSIVNENKQLDGDNYCCVLLEMIEPGEDYIYCTICRKNFKESVRMWIIDKGTCPHCKCKYDEPLIIYTNINIEN